MITAKELRIGNLIQSKAMVIDEKEYPTKIITVNSIIGNVIGNRSISGINHQEVLPMEGRPGLASTWTFDSIEPIPLTPRILEKCGFKKFVRAKDYVTADENHDLDFVNLKDWAIYCIEGSNFYIGIKDGGFFHVEDGLAYDEQSYIYPVGIELKCLHHLQNRYCSMTGEDLTIKETA